MNKLFKLPAVVVLSAIMLICLLIDFLTNGMLNSWFGIIPRDNGHLLGILMHPFAHFGWAHCIGNITIFFVLGFFLRLSFSKIQMYLVFFLLAIIGGIFTWLFAGHGLHGGASGVIYGMWAALITFAIIRRKIVDIIAGVIVGITYGAGIFMGIMPQEGISFEGHFFGIVAGVLAAILIHKSEKAEVITEA